MRATDEQHRAYVEARRGGLVRTAIFLAAGDQWEADADRRLRTESAGHSLSTRSASRSRSDKNHRGGGTTSPSPTCVRRRSTRRRD
jgi:hypothetical protein